MKRACVLLEAVELKAYNCNTYAENGNVFPIYLLLRFPIPALGPVV